MVLAVRQRRCVLFKKLNLVKYELRKGHHRKLGNWKTNKMQNRHFKVYLVSASKLGNGKVRQPRFHLARRKAAFAVRSAGPWNRPPSHLAEAPTVSSFTDRLYVNWCSLFPDIV